MKKFVASGIAALSIAGGSIAIAAVNPFGSAFAQSDGGSTTTVPSEPSTPTPSTPPAPKSGTNCQNKGDNGQTPSTDSDTSLTEVSYRHHGGGSYSGV